MSAKKKYIKHRSNPKPRSMNQQFQAAKFLMATFDLYDLFIHPISLVAKPGRAASNQIIFKTINTRYDECKKTN